MDRQVTKEEWFHCAMRKLVKLTNIHSEFTPNLEIMSYEYELSLLDRVDIDVPELTEYGKQMLEKIVQMEQASHARWHDEVIYVTRLALREKGMDI